MFYQHQGDFLPGTFSFLLQSGDMHIGLICHFKLPIGVNVSTVCVVVYFYHDGVCYHPPTSYIYFLYQ